MTPPFSLSGPSGTALQLQRQYDRPLRQSPLPRSALTSCRSVPRSAREAPPGSTVDKPVEKSGLLANRLKLQGSRFFVKSSGFCPVDSISWRPRQPRCCRCANQGKSGRDSWRKARGSRSRKQFLKLCTFLGVWSVPSMPREIPKVERHECWFSLKIQIGLKSSLGRNEWRSLAL